MTWAATHLSNEMVTVEGDESLVNKMLYCTVISHICYP